MVDPGSYVVLGQIFDRDRVPFSWGRRLLRHYNRTEPTDRLRPQFPRRLTNFRLFGSDFVWRPCEMERCRLQRGQVTCMLQAAMLIFGKSPENGRTILLRLKFETKFRAGSHSHYNLNSQLRANFSGSHLNKLWFGGNEIFYSSTIQT